MKSRTELKQWELSSDVENSKAPILGFRKILCRAGEYTSQKMIKFMSFSIMDIHCYEISGVKDKCKDTDILYISV